MTFDDLKRTAAAAVESGEAGRPVALRLTLELPPAQSDPAKGVALLVPFCEALFASPPVSLAARRDPDNRQWNLIINFSGGQTATVTVIRGAAPQPRLQFLLIGNHGVIRLEGDESLEETPQVSADQTKHWSELVERSLHERSRVEIPGIF